MSKNTKIIIGVIVLVLLFAATAKVSYYLGERHISELVLHSGVPDGDEGRDAAPATGNDSAVRDQLNRLTNDYESACFNYQALYEAYEKLYAQAGAGSGQEKVARPDGARGNEESCYR